MNRKWLVGGLAGLLAVAAVLALVVGGVIGRSIIPSPAPEPPETTRFSDTLTDVSISYPAAWNRLSPGDQSVRLLASAPDGSASVSLSVRPTELATVTSDTLPIVRPLTDQLLAEDQRVIGGGAPVAVELGGLPGYRYDYEFRKQGGGKGAHIHYFLFRGRRLMQIVFQAEPASRMAQVQATFNRIAGSFEGRRG